MVEAFLIVCLVSAGAGLLLRSRVSPTLGRKFLACGAGALVAGLSVWGLLLQGWGPLGLWTSIYVATVLIVIAGLALPFGLAVSWPHPTTKPDGA